MQDLERCPFLREVAKREGQQVAAHIACRPTAPSMRSARPLAQENACDSAATFQLFHGPAGVVPLQSCILSSGAGCPVHADAWAGALPAASAAFATATAVPAAPWPDAFRRQPLQQLSPFAGSPMATLSLSFGLPLGIGGWWAQRSFQQPQNRRRRQQSQCGQPPASGSTDGAQPGSRMGGVQSRGGSGTVRNSSRFSAHKLRNGGRFRSGNAADGNLAKQLSSLVAAGAAGELKCPAAVVAARAAVARLKPVRLLRPQALPTKLLAVGAFTGVANAPSGAARARVRKFSPAWFLAVHATIPFIGMLRKAVVMPKWAIAWTVACAIIGQVLGARLERARLQQAQLTLAGGAPATERTNSISSKGSPRSCSLLAARSQQADVLRQHHDDGSWSQGLLIPAVC